jgi:multidrug efflux pump subunit AcrB
MKISNYAVKNYQFTLIMFLMVAVLGITTIMDMPRSEDPDMNTPQYPIIIVYPGTSPADMEELVINPIEKRIYSLENIKRIRASISDGLAVLNVEYKFGSDVDEKYNELIREIDALRDELPSEIARIDVQKVSPTTVNVLQISLVSVNAPMVRMKETAEALQDELEKVAALKNVEIHGVPEQQARIDLDLEKMAHLGISIDMVMRALQSEMANIPGGSINGNSKSYNIKTSGTIRDIEEIRKTVVLSFQGRNVLMQDIARVYFQFAERKHITRLNGHRAVFVTAAQKAGENISKTQDAYLPALNNFKKTLPANIDMVVNFDQAVNVNNRLLGLGKDFLIAILLVLITLLPLGLRAASVVMVSIPFSLAIGIILLNLAGFNLNQLSIVGFVVALGLLVDDSIVVVENIERWLRDGYSKKEAALKATSQIGLAVLGCTVTLIIAFMPLVFMPEASGEFIRSLPLAVIFSILASLVVSLTVVPFLSSRILKNHAGQTEGNAFLKAFKKGIHKTYAPLLELALKRPVMTVVLAALVFIGSLQLIPVLGFSLFPASEKPQFVVNVISPLQSNIAYTDSISRLIEKDLRSIPEVTHVSTNVGKGNPRIYYNVIPKNEQADYAQLFVQMQENTTTTRKLAIIETLRKKWTPFTGAEVEVKNFEQGPPVIAPVEVRLLGENLDTLRNLALQVESMLNGTSGTLYVTNPVKNLKSDIRVGINRDKASMLGIPTVNIDRAVRMAVAGLEMGKLTDDNGNDYTILLSRPREGVADLKTLKTLYVNSISGRSYPLSDVATLAFETSPLQINHINKTRTVSVSSFAGNGVLNADLINTVNKAMENMKMPRGYRYQMGGEMESRNESFGGFGKIIIITVFFFIAVLVLEFRTFKSTLIVLSVIPLGIVGAVLALLLTGNSLSFVATIGIIALAGIEVKNTILLVDFTNQLRMEGMGLDEAIKEAGEVRFLPIILTTLTAIGGLIPIAISTNPLISPLAIVMIGGLISSTLLSRVVTPVIYKLIPPKV